MRGAGPRATPGRRPRPLDAERRGARRRQRSAGRPSASSCMARHPSAPRAAATAPNARSAGTASSPPRRPRSCSPPTSSGSNRLPRRTISAPRPGTAPSLCALTLTKSASNAPRSVTTWPHAAAASTCTVTPACRHRSTTSCTGWMVPTSWLAHWQCTRAGRGSDAEPRRSRSASMSRRPVPSTPSTSTGAARAERRGPQSARPRRRAPARPAWRGRRPRRRR